MTPSAVTMLLCTASSATTNSIAWCAASAYSNRANPVTVLTLPGVVTSKPPCAELAVGSTYSLGTLRSEWFTTA